MANLTYNSFKRDIMNGEIDLDTDTIKVMIVTSSYTPNQDTHTKKSDITNEVTSSGYTAGGSALTGKTVTVDNTDNEGVFDADDISWTDVTFTARGAVIYKDTGVDANSPLICYIDFGGDKSPEANEFQIVWGAEGIVNIG